MRQIQFIIFILLAFVLSTLALAQKPSLVFHHLSVNDGLSENTVRSILEDKKGYMWFGCEDGLNKYDGYKFTIYRNDNADSFTISSRNIKFLYIDSKKNLWAVTSHGLNIYDPALNIFYSFRNNKYPALKSFNKDVAGITEDKKGNIWVSTANDGLYKIESLYKTPKRFNNGFEDSGKHLYHLLPDSDTSLWVGTRDGLLKFNTVTEKYTDLRPLYGKGYEIRSMLRDKNGGIWLCTTNGLRNISKEGKMTTYVNNPLDPNSISGNNIIDVISYNDDNYLIGIDGGGLDYFDVKNEKFHHYTEELSSNNTNSLYKDSKGDLWVGTYLNGVNYSNATTNLFVLTKNNRYSDKTIKQGIITRFLKDRKENLWIASDGGGLYKKPKDSDKFIHYSVGEKGLSSNVIIALMEDPEGYIWVTTYGGGLCKYDPKNDSFKNFKPDPSNPHSLFNEHTKDIHSYQGKIWISGFGAGINILDTRTEKFTHYRYDKSNPRSIPSDWVQCFYIDRQGTLWMGTFNGLSKFNPTTNNFTNYIFENKKTKNSVDINTVLDIIEDSYGNFWFGTMGNGLVLFDRKDGSYQTFTMGEGLSNNCIKSLIEDNQSNIWLSTNNGITKFNIHTRKAKAYSFKDGVPPCSFYYNSKYKDEQGHIYFGANNGYLMIDPKMTEDNKKIPSIEITDFKIFNQSINPRSKNSPLQAHISETNEIKLSYDQNSLTFEFAALNFNSTQNNKYAYWLEGFDENWFLAGGQRSATYTNLNPGTYIFRVKGSNNDNLWNEEGTSITIIITPPYWKTWWFNAMIISFLISLLYLIHKWRTRIIRNENILLEETVKKRTSELKEANEQLETFVYKASHDIKGPLKSIIGLTTIGKKDVEDGGDALGYFDHILKSTRKLDNLLRDLLEVTKVKQATVKKEKINFHELVSEALASFENFPGYEKLKFSIDIKEKTAFYSDKKLLYSLIQNLIENPIKYADLSKSENTLVIKINISDAGVTLIFKDNGIGIAEEFQKKVFDMFFKVDDNSNGTGLGLYIVKTTVEKLNGSILLESTPGKGSTFTVKF